jgi:Protein kinase domain
VTSRGGDDVPKTVRIERDKPEPFEILEEAGTGGMGMVYKARDRETGQLLAVKVLKDVGDITRFALEGDILSKLQHPGIVEYRHHGLTKAGHPYLAMEWIDGVSLERRLARGVLSVEETLRIARAIADALAVAHAAGVIHRDLKPTNVLLTRETQAVKLVDFGIARSEDVDGLTQTGQALGTPGYMSPEQARGSKIDPRSDLFALGCVVFRCLGGRRPFAGSDIMQFATNLALHDAPPLREVAPDAPVAVEALVSHLLQKDPAARPASALHVRRTIDHILDAVDTTNPAETEPAPAPEHPTAATTRSPGNEPAPPTDKVQRAFDWRLIAMGLVAATAVVVVLVRELGHGSSSVPTPEPKAAAPAPMSSAFADGERTALDRACRQWSSVLAKSQRPDGSFSGEAHAEPSGWDTGQQLFALVESRRACDEIGPGPVASGIRALERLHTKDGWLAPANGEAWKYGVTPANAWAALALEAAAHDMPDPATSKLAALARADLLRAKNPDGGFRYRPESPGPSMMYATLLAAWALIDGEAGADAGGAQATSGAIAWLRREVVAGTQSTHELGLTEELAWLLARAERRGTAGNAGAGTDGVPQLLAKELIDHCRPDASGSCTKRAHETGRIALEPDASWSLITLWHPWTTLAAQELARRQGFDAETKRTMSAIVHWGAGELGRSSDILAAAPEYKIAEYLMVVSELLAAPSP